MGVRQVAVGWIAALAGALACAGGTAEASTLTATVSPNLAPDVSATVTLAGTLDGSDRPRELIAYVHDAIWECSGPLPDLWFGTTVVIRRGERPVGVGPFHEMVAFVPPDVGTYRLCAYADRYDADALVSESTFEVGRAQASISISISGGLDTRVPAHVTVTGTARARRYLTVNAVDRGTCAPGESAGGRPETVGAPWPDNRVGPGEFGGTFAWKPFHAGARELCATVWTESRAPGPDALVTIPIDVVDGAADDAARRRAAEEAELRRQQVERDAAARRRREEDERRRRELQQAQERPQRERPEAQPVPVYGPRDGASRMLLNPRLSWRADPRQGAYPAARDVLTIREVRGRRVRPLLRATTARYRIASAKAAQRLWLARSGRTRSVADVARAGAFVDFRLRNGLPPGTYEWFVSRRNHPAGESRRFTVTSPRLRSIAVRRLDVGGGEWSAPGWAVVIAGAVPYTQLEFVHRHGGGRWTSQLLPGNRSSRLAGSIAWTCATPGGAFQWRLRATDAHGARRTAAGRAPNVSPARCAQLRREQDARDRALQSRPAERRRLLWEQGKRRHDATVRRHRMLCPRMGGTSVWADFGEGRALFCRLHVGGLLPLPTVAY